MIMMRPCNLIRRWYGDRVFNEYMSDTEVQRIIDSLKPIGCGAPCEPKLPSRKGKTAIPGEYQKIVEERRVAEENMFKVHPPICTFDEGGYLTERDREWASDAGKAFGEAFDEMQKKCLAEAQDVQHLIHPPYKLEPQGKTENLYDEMRRLGLEAKEARFQALTRQDGPLGR